MTALNEYQRLESTGVWRASPDAQRRDVMVSVGDATLVIYDMADRALAHWSLPAVERLNPGESPALFAPGPQMPEDLEIADDTMVSAIEKVRQAIARRRPQPGRLRLVLLGGALAAVLALTVFWLPDALIRHAASVVPPAQRAEIGARLLADLWRLAGAPCGTVNGTPALDRLYARLLGDRPGRLVVLAGGLAGTVHLPGGAILLNRALVEDYEDPAVLAGFVLAEDLRARQRDPIERLLRAAGPFAAFRLLTTGEVLDDSLADYAEVLLIEPSVPVSDELLLQAFETAAVPATPYAYALDVSGETTLALIEADAVGPADVAPVLPDGAWVSLQGICGE